MNYLTKNLKNLYYILLHKYYVLKYGLKLKVPLWQLIIHDLSKFSPSEWSAYRDNYRSTKEERDDNRENYLKVVRAHTRRNPHHLSYWNPAGQEPKDIPDKYLREMVADWMASSKCKGDGEDITEWWILNRKRRRLTQANKEFIDKLVLGNSHGAIFDNDEIGRFGMAVSIFHQEVNAENWNKVLPNPNEDLENLDQLDVTLLDLILEEGLNYISQEIIDKVYSKYNKSRPEKLELIYNLIKKKKNTTIYYKKWTF